MKRLLIATALIFSLAFRPAPAEALIIDAPTLAAKISEWAGKLADASTQITTHVSQAKQMTSQGFNKEELFGLAKEYATENGKKLVQEKMKKVVEGTKKKNKDKLQAEEDAYVEGRNLYYDEKIGIVEESIKETRSLQTSKESERDQKRAEVQQKKAKYESVKHIPGEAEKAQDEYMTAQMEYDALVAACTELDTLAITLESQRDTLENEKAKVGTSEDPQYVSYQTRLKELDADKEDETFVSKVADEEDIEWSMKSNPDIVNQFTPTEEDYKKFIERYFYDPEELDSASGDEGRIMHQTKIDAVARERKYLLTNTAAHLLQVTATLRREIPVRTEVIDEMFKNTPKATGELEAISSYSATRIENMKALLMYAKLQSARLQYMAARELLNLNGVKTPNGTYKDFDLEKYILTKEYVDKIVKEADTANNAVTAVEENYKDNGEDYQWLKN